MHQLARESYLIYMRFMIDNLDNCNSMKKKPKNKKQRKLQWQKKRSQGYQKPAPNTQLSFIIRFVHHY